MWDESKLPTVLRKNLPPNLEKIKNGHYTKDDWDYPVHLYLKENDIKVDETGSDVIKFLRGKSILVTGATGFLGKLLVEKLLRCCKDIDTIYIIVRSKKGKDIETRLKEYLDNWVFVKLSEIYPNYRDKVVGISGDLEKDGLDLSDESRKLIAQKVNIIYHIAATIRFDEKLKKAVNINIKGTQEVIKLAKECEQLDVFTYMSTAYSNCYHKEIKEEFYAPVMDPYELIKLTDLLSEEVLDRITPQLLGDCPNTYTFTKQITENLVRKEGLGIPICIQRPSIVIASVSEPVRSWVDNIFGPVGLIEAGYIGLLHVMIGDGNIKCNMVPADYVINNCIVASYKTGQDRITDEVQIFNFTASDKNFIRWKDIRLSEAQGIKVGSTNLIIRGFHRWTKYIYWYTFLNFILHTIPGHILDFFAVRLGKKPLLTNAYTKINKFVTVLAYFTSNEWRFDASNTERLWESLNNYDKKIFKFDMTSIDWPDYFDTYAIAMREFLLFEFLDNLEEGRSYFKKLQLIHYTVIPTIVVLSVYFFINTIFCFIPITIMAIVLFYLIDD